MAESEALTSPIAILKAIQGGAISPKSIPTESRRGCVEHLHVEGYTLAEIAEVLGVSTRTLQRDLQKVRESHALERDPDLVNVMAGRLCQHAEQTISRLRRIARDSGCPHSSKIEAEVQVWTTFKQLIESLQSLGHLPPATREISANLRIESPTAIRAEAERLEGIYGATGDPSALAQLAAVKASVQLPALEPSAGTEE